MLAVNQKHATITEELNSSPRSCSCSNRDWLQRSWAETRGCGSRIELDLRYLPTAHLCKVCLEKPDEMKGDLASEIDRVLAEQLIF